MHPSVWAPAMWQTIHAVALGYPETLLDLDPYRKATYRAFFISLGDVIPCAACAASYRRLILSETSSLDDALDRGTLFEWSVEVHNLINAELGKPTMTSTQARGALLNFRSTNQNSGKSASSSPSGLDSPPFQHPTITFVASFFGFLFAFIVWSVATSLKRRLCSNIYTSLKTVT